MIFLGSPKFNSVILSCRPKSFKSPFASWDFLLLYVYLTPSLPWVTRENVSSPNQYNIKQTSDDNREKYPLGEYKLIHYQIHRPSIIKNLWQTVRRNTHVILGVKVQYNGNDLTKYSKWHCYYSIENDRSLVETSWETILPLNSLKDSYLLSSVTARNIL